MAGSLYFHADLNQSDGQTRPHTNMSQISNTARIGSNTTLGGYCIVEDNVVIGNDCQIGHHVVIREGTVIGNGVRIDDHAAVGKSPMRALNSAVTTTESLEPANIGDGCLIGSSVVIYRGATVASNVLIADLATVREHVSIGTHTIVGRGVAVENRCTIGKYCKLETNAYLSAYSELEDYVFVAPGVLTSNDNYLGRTEERFRHFKGVTVRRGGRLGVGSVILPGLEVGADAVVAAGAVLTRNSPANEIMAGIPAIRMKSVPDEQKLDRQGWID